MALGLVLQQALIISTLVFLAILALWTQAGPILLFAGEHAFQMPLITRQIHAFQWRCILQPTYCGTCPSLAHCCSTGRCLH